MKYYISEDTGNVYYKDKKGDLYACPISSVGRKVGFFDKDGTFSTEEAVLVETWEGINETTKTFIENILK